MAGDKSKTDMVLQDWRQGRSESDTWRSETWQRISDYVMPRKSEISTKKTKTEDGYTSNLFDTTAIHANTTLTSGAMDYLISGKWFALRSPDREASDEENEWYKKCGEILADILEGTNFGMEAHSFFNFWGCFGTSLMHIEEDEDDTIYFKSADIGTYVIFENDKGLVDKVIIKKEFTPRQLEQRYGEVGDKGNKGIPADVMKRAKQKAKDSKDNKIKVLIWIGPRDKKDQKQDSLNPIHKSIQTLHVCMEGDEGNEKGHILRESGYDEMPTVVSRFSEWGDDVYGYCPSVEVMPTIRQVNWLEEQQDILVEVKANPRVFVPDNLESSVNYRAAGVTVIDSSSPQALPQQWMDVGDANLQQDRIDRKRAQIDQSFFVDLFQLLSGVNERSRQKTAFEVAKMLEEKVGRFHPAFTRLNIEFTKPLITRTFNICFRANRFPKPPDAVFKKNRVGEDIIRAPKVQHTSKMAMLIAARKNNDFMAFLEMALPLAEQDPEAFKLVVNFKNSFKSLAENQGVHSEFLNTAEEQAALQQQFEEQAQAMAAMQALQSGSEAAKNLGSAPEGMQEQATRAIAQ